MAALQNMQHVSEFSVDEKLFAFINTEGKLKIWDTESVLLKQDYTPNLHLSAPCTCFTWISVDSSIKSKSKKARKSIDQSGSSLYIALGTSKGGVSLYSYATGKIEQNFRGNGHIGAVTSICRGTGDTLFTCGEDGHIVVWSISQANQLNSWSVGIDKPTCLLYYRESEQILIGSRELKLWSTESNELQQTFVGHTSNIILLKSLQIANQDYALSASKMDRTISLWRIQPGSKHRNAVATFLMADVAYFISLDMDNSETLEIAAVTRSGVVHIFVLDNIDKSIPSKPIKPKVTIEIASDTDKVITPIPIITAKLSYNNRVRSILLGYGDRQCLRFELLEYTTTERNQVLIRNDPTKVTKSATTAATPNKLKTITPIIGNSVEYQTPSALARKTKQIEIPMETRMENLRLIQNDTPTAKNVAHLLIQGLHNQDANILRSVFSNSDEKVIRLTLQRLPPQYTGTLVNELTLLTLKKTSNVRFALTWLRILLQTHTSQLMALGTNELFERFGPLIGVIEHRTNTFKALSKVSGRLDLLTSQIKGSIDDEAIHTENVFVYEDADSPLSSDMDEEYAEDEDSEEEEEEDKKSEEEEAVNDDNEMDVSESDE